MATRLVPGNVVPLRRPRARAWRRAEDVAIGALAVASTWALGAAAIEPALLAIGILTPVALAIALRGAS